jgi:hypothetical protein
VPRSLIERLATALHRTVEEIGSYLALPPRTALGAQYRSPEAPAVKAQIDFRETVEAAFDLSEEQKRDWLGPSDPS